MGDGANGHESRPFALRVADLESAIASLTRAMGSASGDAVVVLASERAALRVELREMAETERVNVIPMPLRR